MIDFKLDPSTPSHADTRSMNAGQGDSITTAKPTHHIPGSRSRSKGNRLSNRAITALYLGNVRFPPIGDSPLPTSLRTFVLSPKLAS